MRLFSGMLGLGSIVLMACTVFLSVLSVVAIVKVIQIAEDLRYLRSKQDLSVGRPIPWKQTMKTCMIAAAGICFVVVFLTLYAAGVQGMLTGH